MQYRKFEKLGTDARFSNRLHASAAPAKPDGSTSYEKIDESEAIRMIRHGITMGQLSGHRLWISRRQQ